MAVLKEPLINKYLNTPFYEKKHNYKFDDFDFNELNSEAIGIYKGPKESVTSLQISGDQTDLKNKSNKKVTVTKRLEYFNKIEQVETALK